MSTETIGNISIPIDTYPGTDGRTKTINRVVGKLLRTVDDSGTPRYWGEISAEYLNPILVSGAARVERGRRRESGKPVDHHAMAIPFAVWPQDLTRPQRPPASTAADPAPADDDAIPF